MPYESAETGVSRQMSEREALECIRCDSGDGSSGNLHEPWRIVVDAVSPRLQRYARRFTRCAEAANDLASIAIFNFYQKAKTYQYRNLSDVLRICCTILRNTFIDDFRRNEIQRLYSGYGPVYNERLSHVPDTAREQVFLRDRYDDLYLALSQLTDQQRCLLHLRYWEGLSLKEIADLFCTSKEAVSCRVYRAHRKLKAHLAGSEFNPRRCEAEGGAQR